MTQLHYASGKEMDMSIAAMSEVTNETIRAEFLKSGWSEETADFISQNWHTSIKGARAVNEIILPVYTGDDL